MARVPRSPPPSSSAVRAAMQGNKRSGTRPEMQVRRLLHGLGYRFRVHAPDLVGRPDIVFWARRKIVQVHGCFWHQHQDPSCPLRAAPRSNLGYWGPKLARNVERDAEQLAVLQADGWEVLTVWECECADEATLRERLSDFLGPTRLPSPARAGSPA